MAEKLQGLPTRSKWRECGQRTDQEKYGKKELKKPLTGEEWTGVGEDSWPRIEILGSSSIRRNLTQR
ncbi:unnamed protein product [Nezara viridula]|uniref:Uncharacterized protein n=1 Tax=Nezara viridula TaxID=85310 RepID=A0A9P0MS31_NEZVI|nr:unnamed protein product [Nezara viridula]